MPFYGAEFHKKGYTTPCCLMTTHNIDEVRQEMLAGIKPKSCNKCWSLEDKGIKSDRQIKNEAYDLYADVDINQVINNCKSGTFSQQIIKIFTSNLCNSACVTCDPKSSTYWQSVLNVPIKFDTIGNLTLDQIDFANIKMLQLVGGEPLYDKNIFNILQRLIDNNNTTCFISVVTNGSVKLTDKQLDMLSKFKNLNICISIDGIGPVFEYLRFPLKWANVTENITQFKKITNYVGVSYTLSNINILYYDETIQWFKKNNLSYNHNLVTTPAYFNINALPSGIKNSLSESIKLFRPHTENDDVLFKLSLEKLKEQDLLKGTNAAVSIPKFIQLFL
jgi:sulfatase maturation enzyme AslB (radical SAM superfamily)